jgi:hypothetical protein
MLMKETLLTSDPFELIGLGGLPRSCSSKLINILAQNPRFQTTNTSTMPSVVLGVKAVFRDIPLFSYTDIEPSNRATREALFQFLKGRVHKTVYIDKSRDWVSNYYAIKEIFPQPKFIVPIRDIRGCLLSKYSSNVLDKALPHASVLERSLQLLQGQILGTPIAALNSLVAEEGGIPKDVLIVKAEDLCAQPTIVLRKLHYFLDEEWYEYNLTNIKALSKDSISTVLMGEPSLHKVESNIYPIQENFEEVLGVDVSNMVLKDYEVFYRNFYPEVL